MIFFSNPWVIGIGGGIVSGIFVTFISRVIISKRENKEYMQRIVIANNEVIHCLKSTISDDRFPEVQVVTALIKSTSRKYKVNVTDMNNIKELAEDLTKEILDTNFIYYDKKILLIDKLKEHYAPKRISKEPSNASVSIDIRRKSDDEYFRYKKRVLQLSTSMLGAIAALISIFALTFSLEKSSFTDNMFGSYSDSPITFIYLIMLLFMLISMLLVILSRTLRIMNKKLNKSKNTKEKDDKEIQIDKQ